MMKKKLTSQPTNKAEKKKAIEELTQMKTTDQIPTNRPQNKSTNQRSLSHQTNQLAYYQPGNH